MARCTSILWLSLALASAACGGTPEPVAPPPAPAASAAAAEPPAPTATQKPAEAPAPTAAPAAPPPAPKTSAFQIDGASISDVTGEQLVAVLKKLGWDAQVTPETHVGRFEQIGISARKDKTNKVIIVFGVSRNAKAPKPVAEGTDDNAFAPKALQARYADTPITVQAYDAEADALVSLTFMKGGTAATAKALLDKILKQPK